MEMRSAGRRGNLDSIGVMAVAGTARQTTGSGGLVGGTVAPGAAAGRCSGRPLGRVRAVRAALPLDDALLGVVGSLRTAAVRIRAGRAGRAGVGIRIAVLLLGRPHPGFRIVADHVVARRLRIRGRSRSTIWRRTGSPLENGAASPSTSLGSIFTPST